MSVDVKSEIVINRPRADVAEIVFDPKSDMLWIEGLKQVFPQSPGKLARGSRVEHRGTMAGLEFVSEVLVTNDDPAKMLEFSSPEPFEMKIRYNLEDVEGGTSLRIRIQSIGDVSRIAMPPSILSGKVREDIEGSLKKLKKHLENNV
jgi:polyketide cyclase/dehydrase/lipid transport protein